MTTPSRQFGNIANELRMLTGQLAGIDCSDDALRRISDKLNDQIRALDEIENEQQAKQEGKIFRQLRLDLKQIGTDNFYIWTISDTKAKVKAFLNDKNPQINVSKPFYVNPFGYRLVCVVTITDKLDVYFALVKGEYDALLEWPFVKKLRFTLLSQVTSGNRTGSNNCFVSNVILGGDQSRIFEAEPKKYPNNWARPSDEKLTDFIGIQSFMSIKDVAGEEPDFISEYLRNDQIYIKLSILDERTTIPAEKVTPCVAVKFKLSPVGEIQGKPSVQAPSSNNRFFGNEVI